MSRRSINIDRLEIRLKGVSPQLARAAVDNLGHELLGQLSAPAFLSGRKRTGKIDHVDSGAFQLSSATPSELRHTITGEIAASIKSKLK